MENAFHCLDNLLASMPYHSLVNRLLLCLCNCMVHFQFDTLRPCPRLKWNDSFMTIFAKKGGQGWGASIELFALAFVKSPFIGVWNSSVPWWVFAGERNLCGGQWKGKERGGVPARREQDFPWIYPIVVALKWYNFRRHVWALSWLNSPLSSHNTQIQLFWILCFYWSNKWHIWGPWKLLFLLLLLSSSFKYCTNFVFIVLNDERWMYWFF